MDSAHKGIEKRAKRPDHVYEVFRPPIKVVEDRDRIVAFDRLTEIPEAELDQEMSLCE